MIERSQYAEPLYAARVGDPIRVASRDTVLHTIDVRTESKVAVNLPLPPAAAPTEMPALEPGLYRLQCDNHPGELAWLVVVDHPYVARTDGAGRFAFEGVPTGSARVLVFTPAGAGLVRAAQALQIESDKATDVSVDVTKSIPPTPAELRN